MFVVPDGYTGPLFLDTRGEAGPETHLLVVKFDEQGYAHAPSLNDGFTLVGVRRTGGKSIDYSYDLPPERRAKPTQVFYHSLDWGMEGLLMDFIGTEQQLTQFYARGRDYQRVRKILDSPPRTQRNPTET